MKIVSLISSATEIACELGLGPDLVGISHECDYPSSILHLPRVSETKIRSEDSSLSIHESVQNVIQKGLSIYKINEELLASLAPDLILTQHQCDVCAVSLSDVESAVKSLTKKETQICSLFSFALDDICKDFGRVGEATQKQAEAEDLVTRFWIRLNQVNAKAGTHLKHRPKVLALEWLDPPIIAGSWIPELITLAGADPLIVDGPKPFKQVRWEELYEIDPEYILVFPCGWSLERTAQEMALPSIQEHFSRWRKTTQAPVYLCDGNQYFNRPGPRIADSLEILGAVFWPEKFPDVFSKHQGKSFKKVSL